MNQSTTAGPLGGPSLVEGTPVFDVANENVGKVSAQDAQAGCLVIQKGWLFPHELYVPFRFIASQDANGVYLNLSKNELKEDRWQVPPTALFSSSASSPVRETAQPVMPPPMSSPVIEPAQPMMPPPPVTPPPMGRAAAEEQENVVLTPQPSGPGADWGALSDTEFHPDRPPSPSVGAGADWGKKSDARLRPSEEGADQLDASSGAKADWENHPDSDLSR